MKNENEILKIDLALSELKILRTKFLARQNKIEVLSLASKNFQDFQDLLDFQIAMQKEIEILQEISKEFSITIL
jgi:hypothetical protein